MTDVTASAEKDALLDTLERLVYLLERGDYVPFGLITEARSLVDAARAKCEACGGSVEDRAGDPVCVSGSYLPHPATRHFPPEGPEPKGLLVGGCQHGAWLGDGCSICGAVARVIPPGSSADDA